MHTDKDAINFYSFSDKNTVFLMKMGEVIFSDNDKMHSFHKKGINAFIKFISIRLR